MDARWSSALRCLLLGIPNFFPCWFRPSRGKRPGTVRDCAGAYLLSLSGRMNNQHDTGHDRKNLHEVAQKATIDSMVDDVAEYRAHD